LKLKKGKIMEITSFILGVCAVIVLAMVVGTFVNYVSVKSLKEHIDTLERDIYDETKTLNQRLDKETERLTDYVDSLHNISENNMNEIYRYIDSRLDKLESKVNIKFNDNTAFVDKIYHSTEDVKQQLNEFIRTYQNQ